MSFSGQPATATASPVLLQQALVLGHGRGHVAHSLLHSCGTGEQHRLLGKGLQPLAVAADRVLRLVKPNEHLLRRRRGEKWVT